MFFRTVQGLRFVPSNELTLHVFEETDLTIDNDWHEFDLSSIVPVGAKKVRLLVNIQGDDKNRFVSIRDKGSTSETLIYTQTTQVKDVPIAFIADPVLHGDAVIEYKVSDNSWDFIEGTVIGWWI